MNPYQQPQNNAPYGQNPSYPQQAGPNKYPTLPSMQNPQYPPQQPQYPDYNAQAGPAGYQPPAQYGNFQAQANNERERQETVKKIEDLEKEFDTCFMNCYKMWLYLLAFLSTVFFVGNLSVYIRQSSVSGPNYITACFWSMAWNVSQSVFGLKAISQKSLKMANIACWMMALVLIPCLILEFFLVTLVAFDQRAGRDPLLLLVTALFTLVICFQVGVSVNGAFRVRKHLIERGMLQEKLQELDYSFKA